MKRNKIIQLLSILWFIIPLNVNAQSESEARYLKSGEEYLASKINDLEPIEGIWSVNITSKQYYRGRLIHTDYRPQDSKVVISKENFFYVGYSVIFANTAYPNVFLVEMDRGQWIDVIDEDSRKRKQSYEERYEKIKKRNYQWDLATLTANGVLEYTGKHDVGNKGDSYVIENYQLIKIFPSVTDYKKSQKSSGTGFCVSSDGIIVTNHHVIEGAKKISVRGVNSNFNRTYNARLLVVDKNNDLALIQIDDNGFRLSENIPFTIKTAPASVGESIFVLGYPLRSTMGDEIKLTNGIISARTGYQGDITTYQISAPVQPGNSDGPVFDSQGYLVGVINAKHSDAENASYAVKSNYLKNLIDMLTFPIQLPPNNLLINKSLSSQVEMAKKFVYIIEAE